MARRGRPPYPDVLTPREFEVLALLREGLSNEEIAARLGVTLAGAKYHVSEILGKLGVSSREEAARWEPKVRPWWAAARAVAPALWLRRTLDASLAARAVAGGLAVAVAAGVALLVWGLVRTEGDGEPPVVVGPTTAAATVAATPQATVEGATVLAAGNAGGIDWSPDGQSLAYGLDGSLYRADAPDFAPYLIATPTSELQGIFTPRWSPDGTRIAFGSSHPGRFGDPSDNTSTIGLMNSDGSGMHDLLPGAAADLAPTNAKSLDGWLDNYTLVFYQGCGTACSAPHLIDTVAGERTSLIGDRGGYAGGQYFWSPDKRWVAAVDREGRNTVVVLDRQGQRRVELPPLPPAGFNQSGTYQGPWQNFDSWSPDSTQILYEQLVITDATSRGTPSLRVYDMTTGEDHELAPVGTYAVWSRAGESLAYVAPASAEQPCGGGDTACIAVMDFASSAELYRVQGPHMSALNAGDRTFTLLEFLEDGRLIIATTELRLAQEGQSEILAAPNGMREFKVSPDGRYVATSEPGATGRVILVPIPP